MLTQKAFILSSAFTTLALAVPSYRSDLYTYTPLLTFPCGAEVERWIGSVGIGTPERSFDLVIDTSTSETWVAGVLCHSEFCKKIPGELYNAGESSTSVNLHKDITLKYENCDGTTATVEAALYDDVLTFSGAKYTNVTFGKAFDVEGFGDPSGFAGYLGLSPPTSSQYQKRSKFSKRAAGWGGPNASSGLFSFGRRSSSRKRNNIQCVLGTGIDQSAIVGDVTWFDLPTCDVKGAKSWKTDLSCFEIKEVIDIKLQDAIAAFDSSVRTIQVPEKHLSAIYKSLNATFNEEDQEYVFKCCYAKDLKFTLDKHNVVLPVDVWTNEKGNDGEYCTANFEESLYDNQWSLGQTFFRNFFSIYDPVEERTGLAISHTTVSGTTISSKK